MDWNTSKFGLVNEGSGHALPKWPQGKKVPRYRFRAESHVMASEAGVVESVGANPLELPEPGGKPGRHVL